nr:MAG TPA: hypothetical protein [Caudoviricetes sp.]
MLYSSGCLSPACPPSAVGSGLSLCAPVSASRAWCHLLPAHFTLTSVITGSSSLRSIFSTRHRPVASSSFASSMSRASRNSRIVSVFMVCPPVLVTRSRPCYNQTGRR